MRNAGRMFRKQYAKRTLVQEAKCWVGQLVQQEQNRKNMGRFIIGRYGGFVASRLQNGTCRGIRYLQSSVLMKQHTSQEVTSCEVEGVSCEASVSDPTIEVVSKIRNIILFLFFSSLYNQRDAHAPETYKNNNFNEINASSLSIPFFPTYHRIGLINIA